MIALCEWGLAGMEGLRGQAAVLVVVDVLSFSTAVDIAVGRGAAVLPFDPGQAGSEAAAAVAGAVPAGWRGAGGFSLSPASLLTAPAGLRLLLPSPNGARLSLAGAGTPVIAGCLRNAAAAARTALQLAHGGAVGVVPAGERWPDGSLRPALEDLLGAGAILHHLGLPCGPEAQVAPDAWRSAGPDLARLVHASRSGVELAGCGYAGDVELAVMQGVSACAPLLQGGAFQAWPGPPTAAAAPHRPAQPCRPAAPAR